MLDTNTPVDDDAPPLPTDFDFYVIERSPALLRLAFLVTGDRYRAEDLVQTTLAKVLRRWDATAAKGDPHPYVRKVLIHTALGWRRRKWAGEQPTYYLPDHATDHDIADLAARREHLRYALLQLPPRQRAAVVLRHYDDLSEEQTAAALGCSVGTVKSQTAKGLAHLRTLLDKND
ncbi:MAG: SigE family RNA polymerase sigma factor [Acidimicrobiia bacterium]